MKSIYEVVATNLVHYRKLRGLSQYKLARDTGISRTTIHLYEKASEQMTLGMLSRLCQALHIEEWELFRRR